MYRTALYCDVVCLWYREGHQRAKRMNISGTIRYTWTYAAHVWVADAIMLGSFLGRGRYKLIRPGRMGWAKAFALSPMALSASSIFSEAFSFIASAKAF